MMSMTDLKPSLQMVHLRQAVSEEAKKLLYQEQIDTVERAFEVLTELFEPHKDSSTLMEEILKITQQPKERLRALVGRIEKAARRYAETLHLSTSELDQLVKSRFKHAIGDPETRNQLLWDDWEMTLSHMIEKEQKFEDFKGTESSKAKKTLRMTKTSSVTDQLKTELAKLKKQMASLQASIEKKSSTARVQGSKKTFICWNCGGRGHIGRHCKKPKVGDGFSFHPKSSQKSSKQGST